MFEIPKDKFITLLQFVAILIYTLFKQSYLTTNCGYRKVIHFICTVFDEFDVFGTLNIFHIKIKVNHK